MAITIKKASLFILKLSISAISLWLVFSKTDIGRIYAILKDLSIYYFLLASLLYVTSLFVSSIRWKLLLIGRFRIRKLFSLYMIGAFFNTFLPGVVGGDAVKAYYLNKDARKVSLTLASIFMDRYFGLISLVIIGMTAYPFALDYFGGSGLRWLMPIIFIGAVVGSFLFFGLKVGKRFQLISEFYGYFSSLKTRKDIIAKALLLSIVIQFLNFTKIIILAYAMGEKIPLLPFFIFLPIVVIITSLPISISGLGLREGSSVLLFGLIGIRPEAATALALAWFFAVVVGSLPGLALYIARPDRTVD